MRIAGFTLFDKNGGNYAYDVQLFKVNQKFEEETTNNYIIFFNLNIVNILMLM